MQRVIQVLQHPFTRAMTAAILLTALLGITSPLVPSTKAATSSCKLSSANGNIQHVIYLQFDNVHLTRDNPNVLSDLEQMPHLLDFITDNGTMLANHHTPLIAHTADDILTSLTGVYGDRHGVPVANTFRYFNPNGTSNLGVSFAYWTDPIYDPTTTAQTDTTYNMLSADGKNAPAPWVPYTRAGCNVGSVAVANTSLENVGVDVANVYGAGSPQAAEAKANSSKAEADFEGIAVHCAQSSATCSGANGGRPDLLPGEPGGYTGYNALFGHQYVAPQISPSGPLKDLNGGVIKNSDGYVGFPGFDGMDPATSLAYVASMQEHGVPVTYAYLADAHEGDVAYGPGQKEYVAKLKAFDAGFASFFARLQKDGINKSNTLFVITADENDHFVGGAPTPANCNGVTTPCTYKQIGELDGNLTGLLATQQGNTTPFKVHADSAPNFYVTGNPAQDVSVTRTLERAVSQLTATNSITGKTDLLTNYLADQVEMKLLHMVTADPARTPTFTMFANPNYYLSTGDPNCAQPCVQEYPPEAWNHGDVAPDINTTWLGLVGPGVRQLGINKSIWSDHTDIRPTILSLVGLKDDYVSDGRVLFEALTNQALPDSVTANRDLLTKLAQVYKQINAPVGELGLVSLIISTKAIASKTTNDTAYKAYEGGLNLAIYLRNTIAGGMSALLNQAEFGGQSINVGQAKTLLAQADALLKLVNSLSNI